MEEISTKNNSNISEVGASFNLDDNENVAFYLASTVFELTRLSLLRSPLLHLLFVSAILCFLVVHENLFLLPLAKQVSKFHPGLGHI